MMNNSEWQDASREFKFLAAQGMKQQIALLDFESLAAAIARNPSALFYATINPTEKANPSQGYFHSAWMLMFDNLDEKWISRMASSLKMQSVDGWEELSEVVALRPLRLLNWERSSSWNAFLDGIDANHSAPEGFSVNVLDLSMRGVARSCSPKENKASLGVGRDAVMAKRWRLAWCQAFESAKSPRDSDVLVEMWAAAMCEKIIQKEWGGARELLDAVGMSKDLFKNALDMAVAAFVDELAGSGRGAQINMAAANMIATAASTAPAIIASSMMECPLLDGRALAIIERKVIGAQSKPAMGALLPRRRGISL